MSGWRRAGPMPPPSPTRPSRSPRPQEPPPLPRPPPHATHRHRAAHRQEEAATGDLVRHPRAPRGRGHLGRLPTDDRGIPRTRSGAVSSCDNSSTRSAHGVPAALTEVITLGRTLARRVADILANFDRLHREITTRDRRIQTTTTPDCDEPDNRQVAEEGPTPVSGRVSPTDPIRHQIDALFEGCIQSNGGGPAVFSDWSARTGPRR